MVVQSQSILLQDELEKVQKRATRYVTGNYVDYETGSMTGILKQLKWESLKKRKKDSRLIMLSGESQYCGFFLLEHVISTYKTQK